HYLNETSSRNEPYDKIHRILLKNGKVKTLLRKGTVVFDDQGKPVKMVGTTQDVTAQHKIQEELKDNQTFIRKITDATPSIIGSYNVHSGKYVFISEGLEKLLGYKTADVSQKGALFFSQIIHPDDMEKVKRVNEEAIQQANANQGNNDLVIETIYRLRHCNGHYRWFHTYGTIFDRNKQGQVEHFLNITLDVTAQIVAEEKIADQELFIQRVADASPTILYIFTVSSNSFEYINKELFFVLGYTTEEVENMGDNVVETLYHPEDINQLPERKESTKKFQHRNSMIQYECRIRSKEGDWKWLLVREVIFKTTEDGKAAQVLGAALDITKRKEMERSLLQNSFHLEQSNASLEEFAYVASHDLKEPLRKISTFGDRIVSTQLDKLTPEGKMYLTKIVDASQRMQVMINDLLSISLISGDRSFQKFSLQAVLEDAKQALEYKIEQKNAVIEGVRLPQASIVPSQFRQLFQNLLSNSLKFVSDNRVPLIRVEACYIPAEEVKEFQMVMAPQYLKLTFEDNGIGFEEEYSGKIFQIFQRLHGKSEYEGTGIGLAICKKIVEHHGGVIYATGMPEQGAVFTIILPA
ncbi:MAG: PAS domain-containing protein, partial [Chitinophagaceae bacterium]